MSTIAIVCKFAAIHTTTEMNFEAWVAHFEVERESDICRKKFERVLEARSKFHAAHAAAVVEVSSMQGLSLLQAERVVSEILTQTSYKHYQNRQARGI